MNNYIHNPGIHNTSAANEVLPFIFNSLMPRKVLDVGCGLGTWLRVAKDLGAKEVLGIDGNKPDEQLIVIDKADFLLYDLNNEIDLKTKFDLSLCLEVAEHLPESSSENLIKTLVKNSDIILFSAAIPGQDGQNHVNEQWPEYWNEKFKSYGFSAYDALRLKFWDNKKVEWWYRQNMIIYSRKDLKNVFGSASTTVSSLVHPSLFENKKEEITSLKDLMRENIHRPKFISSLKLLIKSIIK